MRILFLLATFAALYGCSVEKKPDRQVPPAGEFHLQERVAILHPEEASYIRMGTITEITGSKIRVLVENGTNQTQIQVEKVWVRKLRNKVGGLEIGDTVEVRKDGVVYLKTGRIAALTDARALVFWRLSGEIEEEGVWLPIEIVYRKTL